MEGIIRRVQVTAHPIVIVESFGVKVLVRALLAGTGETFLEIVRRSAEDEAHLGMDKVDLMRTVNRFIGFECRVRDVYRRLSQQLSAAPKVAKFFANLSGQEEGHAIILSRVQREIRQGRLWKKSKDLHFAIVEAFEGRLSGYEEERPPGPSLRARTPRSRRR